MHEVSLVESLIALCEEERRKQPFSKVRLVRLELGAIGCVEAEAIRFCFDAVARGTLVEGAELEIDQVGGAGWCPGCRCTVPLAERFSGCPLCGSSGVHVTAGDVLRLAELEVE